MRKVLSGINMKIIVTNSVIFLMIFSLSIFAFFGKNLITVSKIYNNVYYSGDEKANKISLMINVYWGSEYLVGMLEILKKYNVKTTFFVGGTWAVKNADLLEKIFMDGHEIANHGYYHKNHKSLSREKNFEEISNTHNIVKNLIGVEMNLFAPPSGEYSKTTVEVAQELGYKTIMWTQGKDTIDWRDKDSDLIFKRATENAKGGDFVLMHPTLETKNALERIVVKLQQMNLRICPVSENLLG